MALSLLIALITYMASPKGTPEQRRRALLNAAAAGGATYVATEYTDWGRDISGQFDDAIGIGGSDSSAEDADGGVTTKPPVVNAGGTGTGSGSTGGFSSWWPPVLGAGVAGVAVGSGAPSWLIWAGIGLTAYLILK